MERARLSTFDPSDPAARRTAAARDDWPDLNWPLVICGYFALQVVWRRLLGGSLLGAGALVVLQVGGSFLVGSATSNPLLATFTVFIGLLLWFRLSAIVTLVAAAFIYTAARDRNESLRLVTPAQLEVERAITEHNAKVVTARVAVRDATDAVAKANWITRPYAKRVLAAAQNRLADLEAWTPPTVRRKSWLSGGGSAKKPGGTPGGTSG